MIHPQAIDTTTPRERCLEAAREIVMKRGARYRAPLPFFQKLAKRWSLLFGIDVSAREVVLALIDLKIERATQGPHEDNPIDIAGYAACLAEIDSFSGAAPIAAPARATDAPPLAGQHSPHWPRVLAFAEAMDEKLRENWHHEEVAELAVELEQRKPLGGSARTILREAADVANFAMMIADLFGGWLRAP